MEREEFKILQTGHTNRLGTWPTKKASETDHDQSKQFPMNSVIWDSLIEGDIGWDFHGCPVIKKKKKTLGIDCVLPKPSNQDSQPVYKIYIQA